jgi:hypothetical protein
MYTRDNVLNIFIVISYARTRVRRYARMYARECACAFNYKLGMTGKFRDRNFILRVENARKKTIAIHAIGTSG